MPRMLLVGVGPEERSQTLARDTPATSGSENREEREPRRAQPWHGRWRIGFEAEASEREEAQHLDQTLALGGSPVKRPDRQALTPR